MNHGNQRHKAVSMGLPHFSVFGTSFWSNPALNSRTFSRPKTINLPHSIGWRCGGTHVPVSHKEHSGPAPGARQHVAVRLMVWFHSGWPHIGLKQPHFAFVKTLQQLAVLFRPDIACPEDFGGVYVGVVLDPFVMV